MYGWTGPLGKVVEGLKELHPGRNRRDSLEGGVDDVLHRGGRCARVSNDVAVTVAELTAVTWQ